MFFNFFKVGNFFWRKFEKKLKNTETDLRSVYNFFPELGSYLTLYFNSKDFDFSPPGGEAINMAKEEIFITDWWFDPEIDLIRDEDTQNSFGQKKVKLRDLLIKCVVERGVKVFVLVYGNVESGTGLNRKPLNNE